MQPKATAIDLFSGAGGLSLGLQSAGFNVVAALDNDPISIETYNKNLGPHGIVADIQDVNADELLGKLGLSRGECVLLAGGPPCQGFSLQRRGSRDDPRNGLVLHFIRLIEEIRPEFFLMENVSGLMSKHGRPFLEEFKRRMGRLGYTLNIDVLNASDFGVPQRRLRAFLVGARDGMTFTFPKPGLHAVTTVRDAIADLPSPPLDGKSSTSVPNHFRELRLAAINIERIKHVPQGGGRLNIPDHLQLDCHRNNATHRHLDVYGRLAWDEPSVTLTARFDSFTRGRFAHPEEHRSLTVREGARIQTFPDWFEFLGNREEQARQVGNAVPPMLAEVLAETILAHRERAIRANEKAA
ncbi:DNA cytosine methyltransferase [Rhizobium leguminosarum]|uniref:DNA cytosine methyltransferase n=1 Tax=Rhizobium leguminosarum TaxID=384 RepID=UPI001C97C275|nr:DNA cytosine methyltransferase [Rhizobium leguminosarum]MBY5473595.1 DNA cytosine methyltransferase [Rhizobium leguminosarum]